MSHKVDQATSRRLFLKFLAGSPLAAYGGLSGFEAFAGEAPSKLPDPIMWAPQNLEELIKTPKEAINVFDFEPVCRRMCLRRISATWPRASTTK